MTKDEKIMPAKAPTVDGLTDECLRWLLERGIDVAEVSRLRRRGLCSRVLLAANDRPLLQVAGWGEGRLAVYAWMGQEAVADLRRRLLADTALMPPDVAFFAVGPRTCRRLT